VRSVTVEHTKSSLRGGSSGYTATMQARLVAVFLLGACGSSGPAANPDGGGGDASGGGDANAGWTPLISRTWTLGPGGQNYECRRIQVPTEMWISGFRAMSPPGTHHSVLTISTNSSQLGDYDCSAGNLDLQMLYASGVNTDDLVFPAGMAVHIPAGQYINLNLHLFNATDNTLNEESGVLVQTVPASQVTHEIDMVFSGTFNINIPSDGQPHTATGGCAAPTSWNIFALWPHMHQTATHQTFTVTHAGTPATLLDTPYMFTEQRNYPMAQTLINQGDQITTTCTYVNTTGQTINFGDSSTKEMCFTGIYKYPAGGSLLSCVSM